jgi:hypothetical protein
MTTLNDELRADPKGLGYAPLMPDAPGQVVELLNALTESMVKPRFITARTILAECEDGAAILDALSAAASAISAVKWALTFLSTDSGIDVGHARTQGMIDNLVEAGAMTQALAEQLKALAIQSASRAEVLGIGVVTEEQVRAAWQI